MFCDEERDEELSDVEKMREEFVASVESGMHWVHHPESSGDFDKDQNIEKEVEAPLNTRDGIIKKIRDEFEDSARKTHDLTRDPENLSFYLCDDVQQKWAGYFAGAFDRELDLEGAFSTLELYGVPRERANGVALGIMTLAQRVDRERLSSNYRMDCLQMDNNELIEALEYFIARVDHGTIHSNTTYKFYKDTLAGLKSSY